MFERKRSHAAGSLTPFAACVVALVLGLHLPSGVASQLPESVQACAQEPDDAKRLACYDNAAGRAPPATAPAVSRSAPAPRPMVSSPAAPKATQITASVSHITRRADGRYVITLDNGQVWSEVETKERFSVNTGDTITIRSELLGAHYLRTPLGADVRVVNQP